MANSEASRINVNSQSVTDEFICADASAMIYKKRHCCCSSRKRYFPFRLVNSERSEKEKQQPDDSYLFSALVRC